MRRPVAAAPATYLRRPVRDDGPEFTRLTRASAELHGRWVSPAADPTEYAAWLARGNRPDIEQFLVCRRDDDAICGFANLNNIVLGSLRASSIGWAAFAGREGAGHLTTGVELVLRTAFTAVRLHRVEANIQPGNERSRALAIRCGFRLEGFSPRYLRIGGEWRDHERWAIDEDTWRARTGP